MIDTIIKNLAAMLILAFLVAPFAAGNDGSYILVTELNNCQGTEHSEIGGVKPSAGNSFVVMGLSIENHGYDGFSVDPSSFSASINGFDYKISPTTYYLDRAGFKPLPSGNLRNGASITGYVAYEIPSGYKDFKVQYAGWEDVKVQYACG